MAETSFQFNVLTRLLAARGIAMLPSNPIMVVAVLAGLVLIGAVLLGGHTQKTKQSASASQPLEEQQVPRAGQVVQIYRPVSGRPLRQARVMGIEGNKAKFIAPDGAIYSRRLGQVTLVH